jgi:hypothetical protein
LDVLVAVAITRQVVKVLSPPGVTNAIHTARYRFKKRQMDNSVKDRLASQALDLLIDFEMALSERTRNYPVQEFFAFARAARRYIDLTRRDQLVRRDVAVALKDFAECLEPRRKGVPDAVLLEAHRLESLFFDGYDPYFEGDQPPGL